MGVDEFLRRLAAMRGKEKKKKRKMMSNGSFLLCFLLSRTFLNADKRKQWEGNFKDSRDKRRNCRGRAPRTVRKANNHMCKSNTIPWGRGGGRKEWVLGGAGGGSNVVKCED